MLRRGILATLTLVASSAPAAAEPARAERVLLLTIDTLRADHLGHAGYGRPTSPALDALADESARFESFYVHAPWTLPSLGTTLTSVLPRTHQVLSAASALPEEATTLAERFAAAGFHTAAFVHSPFDLERAGLAQGFDHFEATLDVTTSALAWLAAAEPPFFLWVHHIGPHGPYDAAPEFREGFVDGPVTSDELHRMYTPPACEGMTPGAALERIVSLYDAKIRQADAQVAPIIAALRGESAWSHSAVVVLSDHGEEFLEHGGCSHGASLHEEMLRVPLLVAGPGVRARAIGGLARSLDVAPTLLELAGLEPPPDMRGTSMVGLLRAATGDAPHDEIVADAQFLPAPFAMLRKDERKVICPAEPPIDPAACRAFDLAADPGERHPLVDPAWAAPLVERLEGLVVESRDAAYPPSTVEVDRQTRERLRALGYPEDALGYPEAQ